MHVMVTLSDSVVATLWTTTPALLTASVVILAAWLLVAHAGVTSLRSCSLPVALSVATVSSFELVHSVLTNKFVHLWELW